MITSAQGAPRGTKKDRRLQTLVERYKMKGNDDGGVYGPDGEVIEGAEAAPDWGIVEVQPAEEEYWTLDSEGKKSKGKGKNEDDDEWEGTSLDSGVDAEEKTDDELEDPNIDGEDNTDGDVDNGIVESAKESPVPDSGNEAPAEAPMENNALTEYPTFAPLIPKDVPDQEEPAVAPAEVPTVASTSVPTLTTSVPTLTTSVPTLTTAVPTNAPSFVQLPVTDSPESTSTAPVSSGVEQPGGDESTGSESEAGEGSETESEGGEGEDSESEGDESDGSDSNEKDGMFDGNDMYNNRLVPFAVSIEGDDVKNDLGITSCLLREMQENMTSLFNLEMENFTIVEFEDVDGDGFKTYDLYFTGFAEFVGLPIYSEAYTQEIQLNVIGDGVEFYQDCLDARWGNSGQSFTASKLEHDQAQGDASSGGDPSGERPDGIQGDSNIDAAEVSEDDDNSQRNLMIGLILAGSVVALCGLIFAYRIFCGSRDETGESGKLIGGQGQRLE